MEKKQSITVLIVAMTIVGASTAILPSITGYGTQLFQLVVLGAWGIVAAITSDMFADQHDSIVWTVAFIINVILFTLPAVAIFFTSKSRLPKMTNILTLGWLVFYLNMLFILFPAIDGP